MGQITNEPGRAIIDPDIWEEQINEYYFPIDVKPIGDGFYGDLERVNMGRLSLVRCGSEASCYERTKSHINRLIDEYFLVTIPVVSEAISTQRGHEKQFRPHEMFIERVHEPFVYTQPDRNIILTLCVEGRLLHDHVRNADLYCGAGFDASRGLGRMFGELMWNTLKRADELSKEEMDVIGRHLVELLTLVLRNDDRIVKSGSSSVRAAHLRRIEKIIATCARDPDLSPSLVADRCGISLRYLHQIFAETEYSVAHYIRRQRLIATQALLKERPDLKLAEIAYRCGFNDHAALSRQFKGEFGISPSDYRATLREQRPGLR